MGNGSIMISDSTTGTAVVVEITDEGIGVRNGVDGMIGNCNDRTIDMSSGKPYQNNVNWPVDDTMKKQQPLTVEQLKQKMGSQSVLQWHNIMSVIFIPAENRMLMSCGRYRAALGNFTEYKLFQNGENKDIGGSETIKP